jgi:hypothetical protein
MDPPNLIALIVEMVSLIYRIPNVLMIVMMASQIILYQIYAAPVLQIVKNVIQLQPNVVYLV